MKTLLFVLGVIAVVGGGIYWFKSTEPPKATQDTYSQATTTPATSTPITQPQPQITMHATLHTTKGDITIEFFPQNAPKTVANFIKLAESGFYNGVKFHRVIRDFMDQAGDPLTKDDSKKALWGTGGPGYKFDDEISANNSNAAGAIAMANSGPNTQGSQFFINARDNHNLDSGYTVFGKVTSGMDVVLAINTTPTDSSDRPLTPVVINSVTLSQ